MEPIVYTGEELRRKNRKMLKEIEDMQELVATIENYHFLGFTIFHTFSTIYEKIHNLQLYRIL